MKKIIAIILAFIVLIPINAFASDGVSTLYGNENIKYQFNIESGNLLVYGNGEINDYVKAPFDVDLDKITSVTINDGITRIGKRVFRNCENINTVVIGSTVSSIDVSAFDGCDSIKEYIVFSNNEYYSTVDGVIYSKDLTDLVKYPAGNTNESFTTISSNENILKDSFKGCKHLKKIILSSDIKNVNEDFSKLGIDCSKVTVLDDTTEKPNTDGHTHKYTFTTIGQTCTEFGYGQKTCDECGVTYIYKYIAPNGHTFENEKDPASFNSDGHNYNKCIYCGYIETDDIIYRIDKAYLDLEKLTYTGIAISPIVTILDSRGNILVKGIDYTYTLPTNRKYVGKHSYNIMFKGDYQGETTLDFYVYPSKTSLTYIILRPDEVELKWSKRTAQCDGYVVSYSTDPEFKKNVFYKYVNGKSKSSLKIDEYKHKQIYFFRIRTYKTVGEETYFSDWSNGTGAKTL